MYDQITSNVRRSWLLILVFIVMISGLGWVFGRILGFGNYGVVIALGLAVVLTLVSFYTSDRLVLAMSGAKEADPKKHAFLINTVEGLSIAAGIPAPKVYIINDTALNAFATGRDPDHSMVAVTAGLLDKLDRLELEGVIAHEISHIKNYDIRLMTLTVVLVGVVVLMSDWLLRSFWWGGRSRRQGSGGGFGIILIVGLVLSVLAPLFANLIRLAVSRQREFLADASGAMLTRYPPGLASALRKIGADNEPLEAANTATAHLFIGAPKQRGVSGGVKQLLTTHPPIEERVKRLEEM